MIELAMVFGLGVLAASLVALLALPLLSRRARRDERLRLERRLPLSLPEIAAERDQIRAAHAVAIRKVEQRAEVLAARAAAAMAEAGRRSAALAIAEARRQDREAIMDGLRSDLSRATGRAEAAEAAMAAQGRQIETLDRRVADAEARARDAEATAQAIGPHDVEERRAAPAGLAGPLPEAATAEPEPMAGPAGAGPPDEPVQLRAALARLRTEQDTMRKAIAAATRERDRLRLRVDELLLRIADMQEEAEAGGQAPGAASPRPAREPPPADAATLRLAIAALAADLVRSAVEPPAADPA